jgi:hypothetical protein
MTPDNDGKDTRRSSMSHKAINGPDAIAKITALPAQAQKQAPQMQAATHTLPAAAGRCPVDVGGGMNAVQSMLAGRIARIAMVRPVLAPVSKRVRSRSSLNWP